MADRLRAGIIGAGFMGDVHARAVRAARGEVTCVASSVVDHAAAALERLGANRAVGSVEELVAADDVDVVHICSPNAMHAPFAQTALAAGKHVVCEKPLATSVADAAAMVEAAEAAGVVATVPLVYRSYAMVREARARISAGEAGQLRLLSGSYLQDWLAAPEDTDWRISRAAGGPSRVFADIGIHWCDLVEFVTGHRITRLSAHTATTVHRARPPTGPSEPESEDVATVVFETDRGASGVVLVSQVSLGRKNRLSFSLDGASAAYLFDQENPELLTVAGRHGSLCLQRDPSILSPSARPYARLPAGHPEGYQDCFNAFMQDTYATVRGEHKDGLPTFADGLRAAVLTAAVLKSAQTRTWIEVPLCD